MRDAQRITIAGKQMTVPQVRQSSYEVPRARKIDALTRILDAEAPQSAMIFCRTKAGVDELGEALMARGYAVETIHGDLSQAQRDPVMRRFRSERWRENYAAFANPDQVATNDGEIELRVRIRLRDVDVPVGHELRRVGVRVDDDRPPVQRLVGGGRRGLGGGGRRGDQAGEEDAHAPLYTGAARV